MMMMMMMMMHFSTVKIIITQKNVYSAGSSTISRFPLHIVTHIFKTQLQFSHAAHVTP